MTAKEYGRIASKSAEIIQEELDSNSDANPGWEEPEIAVQIWNQSVGEQDSSETTGNTGLDVQELTARNAAVMEEFSTEGRTAIDTLVGHFYFGADGDR